MLVGDRGRIIPFRHFKGIALSVCCVSILLLAACIAMTLLYLRQGQTLSDLESELNAAQAQKTKLRDEKDLYLTKLMLTQKQEKAEPKREKASGSLEPQAPETEKAEDKIDKTAAAKVEPKTIAPVKKDTAPEKPPAPKVEWKADIRRFSVSYDAKLEVLKARFRIYNTSKPKKRLSGRSVIVFKVQDDSTVKSIPVPRVQLRDGEPTGTRGQVFRVRNYLTMNFRAYRQKAPISFNTATVFVFSEKGRILASKDFAFKIDAPPPPPPPPKKPPEPPPATVEIEKPAPAPDQTTEIPVPKHQEAQPSTPAGEQKSAGPAVTDTETNPAQEGPGPSPADESPLPSSNEKTPASNERAPADATDTPSSGEAPVDSAGTQPQSEPPTVTEPTVNAPKPNVEGAPK